MKGTTVFIFCCLAVAWLCPSAAQAETEEEYQQQILTLRKHNTLLDNQLEQVTAELKHSDKKVSLLQRQVAKMTQNAEKNTSEVQETRQAMKQVKAQLQALLEQQAESNTEKNAKEMSARLKKAKERTQDLEIRLKKEQEERKTLEKKITTLQKNSATSDADDSQTEFQQLRRQFKANLKLLHEREQELQTLKKGMTATAPQDGALRTAQQKIEALQQEVSLLQLLVKQKKERTEQDSQLQEDHSLAEQRIRELETNLAETNAQVLEISREKSRLEQQVQAQLIKQDDTSGQNTEEIRRLEGELRKAADFIATLNQNLAEVNNEKARLSQDIKELEAGRQNITGKEAEMQRMTNELRDANDEILRLDREKQNLTTQISQMQASSQKLQKELSAGTEVLQSQNRQTQTQLADLQMQYASLEQTNQQTQAQNRQLEESLTTLTQELQQQGSVPEAAKQRIEELTLEIQDVRTQLDRQLRYKEEFPALQREVETLRAQLADASQKQEQKADLDGQLREMQAAYALSKEERDAVVASNLELKARLHNNDGALQTQEEKFAEIMRRNQELAEQYREGRQELAMKEHLLQQALTEKSLVEKYLDEKGSPFDALNAQVQQLQSENTKLQQQLHELNAAQVRLSETPQTTPAGDMLALRRQLATEKAARQQLETQVRHLQQQRASATLAASPTPTPTFSATANWPASVFPPDLLQRASGGTISMLGWSPNHDRLAYLESGERTEQLWIYTQTLKRQVKITEWPRANAGSVRTSLTWAYDNEHFLCATGLPGQYTLYIGNGRQLVGTPIRLRDQHIDFAWAPNQLQFAYFSGPNLIVSNVRGETLPLQIGHEPGAVGTSLAWSPDGGRIVFSSKRGKSVDIFTLLFSGQTPLLQALVTSSSDDIQPSWSPDGRHIAFYVQSGKYDTKLAVVPIDKSRAPYIVGHNVSLPLHGGPVWLNGTSLLYVGGEYLSASQNSMYRVDITNGRRSAAPLSILLGK